MSTVLRRFTIPVPFIVFASTLSSCGQPPPAGPALSVHDSVGIEIVDFDLDQAPEYGSVGPDPDWVFGESPDHRAGVPLTDVRDAKLLGDGRVAVINGMAQEVLLVHPDRGQWQRLGGRGEGPGEFRFIGSVSEDGDGIGVYDEYRRRWVTFMNGELVGSQELPPTGVPGIPYPEVIIPDGDGFFVCDAFLPPGAVGGEVTRRLVLVARVEGDRVDTLTVIPGDMGIPKGTGVSPRPFVPGYAVVKGDSGLWMGDSALPRVRFWSGTGELGRVVRWRYSQDRTLTRRRINAYRDRVTAGRPASYESSVRKNFREAAFPSDVPAWGTLVRGIDGVLWISDYPGPEVEWPVWDPYPTQLWWGIDDDGRPVGSLASPAGLQVTGFGEDFLIGIHKDTLGVETVRRHRIVKPKGVANSR